MRAFLLYILFLQLSGFALADTHPKNLKEWDSIAFAALEGNKSNALEIAEKFKEATLKKPPSLYQVNAYTILGILNKDKGYYISAINNYLNALNAAEAIGDEGRTSACLNNIGQIYFQQQNYERAKEYYFKALKIEEKLNNPLQKSIRYYNLGEAYLLQDSLDIALTYFNNSLQLEQRMKSDEGIMYALMGISEVYIKIGRLTDAEINLENLKKYPLNDFPKLHIQYLTNLGLLEIEKSNFDTALQQLSAAEKLSNQYNLRIFHEEIYKNRIIALKALGKWKELSDAYSLYIDLLEELNNTKVKNQLEDLTYQNEINKRELELKLVAEERDLAKKRTVKERNIANYEKKIVWFLVLSLVGLVVLIFFGIRKITKG